MLFITLGDRPMDPSPRPPNQLIGPARVDPHPRSKPRPDRDDAAPTDRADRSCTPTTPCDPVIFVVRIAILIKCQLFSSFGQLFCYIVAIVLSYFCYNTQSFLL
jgi:hypothetical protein